MFKKPKKIPHLDFDNFTCSDARGVHKLEYGLVTEHEIIRSLSVFF